MSTPGRTLIVQRRQRHESGFTLIEMMVAALLLMIILAGFIPVFLSGLGTANRERFRSLATNLAQERIEQIRALDYREIGDASALVTRYAPNSGNDPTVRGATFHIDYAVASYEPAGASQPLKQVTVIVSWGASPAPSPIEVSTMIDQMYLGPRGSSLEIVKSTSPSLPADAFPLDPDPAGTPFPWAKGAVKVRYHVAQADWGMVLNDVANPAAGAQNVYLRLVFADDKGVTYAAGDPASDNKINNTYMHYTTNVDGAVNDVYFEYPIAQIDGYGPPGTGLLPDGYWNAQAALYNAYDQPGNVWQLRVHVTGNPPGQPQVVATPIETSDGWNQVLVTWVPGGERDRDHFVLTRSVSGPQMSWTLPAGQTSYTDTGDVNAKTDPWGDATHTNQYTYSVHAVDNETPPLTGPDGTATVSLPGTTTTTAVGATTSTTSATTTSTTNGTTTTTNPVDWVKIVNNTNQSWAVTIRNFANAVVWTGTIDKNTIQTVPGLTTGSYSITGSRTTGNQTVTASFTMPGGGGTTVLTIS